MPSQRYLVPKCFPPRILPCTILRSLARIVWHIGETLGKVSRARAIRIFTIHEGNTIWNRNISWEFLPLMERETIRIPGPEVGHGHEIFFYSDTRRISVEWYWETSDWYRQYRYYYEYCIHLRVDLFLRGNQEKKRFSSKLRYKIYFAITKELCVSSIYIIHLFMFSSDKFIYRKKICNCSGCFIADFFIIHITCRAFVRR